MPLSVSAIRCLRRSLCALLFLSCAHVANASLIVGYNTGSNPSGGLAASETGSMVSASSLTRGAGLTTGPGTSSYSSDGWDTSNASFADAIADQELLTWGWTSSPSVDLGHLEIRYDRSNQGPTQMRIDLAVNGGGFSTVYSDAAVPTTGTSALNIDLSAFTAVTSAVFRLVAFGASNTNGTFDIENYQTGPNRGIAVFTAVPEPTSLALMGIAAIGIGIRRRQRVTIST